MSQDDRGKGNVGAVRLRSAAPPSLIDSNIIIPEPWVQDALCPQTDPDAFFPEKGGSTRDAKRICATCDVVEQCLEYALRNDERFGIWGGKSERERRRLRKAMPSHSARPQPNAWSDDDESRLRQMIGAHAPYARIASVLGRSVAAVQTRASELGIRHRDTPDKKES